MSQQHNRPLTHLMQFPIGPDTPEQKEEIKKLPYQHPQRKVEFHISCDDVIQRVSRLPVQDILAFVAQLDQKCNNKHITETLFRYFKEQVRINEATTIIRELDRDLYDQHRRD